MLLGPMYAFVIKGASFAEASRGGHLATALRTVLEQRGSTLGTELTLVAILGTTLWTDGGDGGVLNGMAARVAAEIFDVEATAARAYRGLGRHRLLRAYSMLMDESVAWSAGPI
jgi:hypothetical protein